MAEREAVEATWCTGQHTSPGRALECDGGPIHEAQIPCVILLGRTLEGWQKLRALIEAAVEYVDADVEQDQLPEDCSPEQFSASGERLGSAAKALHLAVRALPPEFRGGVS